MQKEIHIAPLASVSPAADVATHMACAAFAAHTGPAGYAEFTISSF